jgi:hypothetical protein
VKFLPLISSYFVALRRITARSQANIVPRTSLCKFHFPTLVTGHASDGDKWSGMQMESALARELGYRICTKIVVSGRCWERRDGRGPLLGVHKGELQAATVLGMRVCLARRPIVQRANRAKNLRLRSLHKTSNTQRQMVVKFKEPPPSRLDSE